MRRGRCESDPAVRWRQVGPGMAGYNEQIWFHPSTPGLMFITPDMLNAYRSEDSGASWESMKDPDGTGVEATRFNGLDFARGDGRVGLAVNRQGLWRTDDEGRSWRTQPEWATFTPGDIYAVTRPPASPALSIFGGVLGAVAFDPADDDVAYVGSGDFFNAKLNPHTVSHPHGRLPSPDRYWRANTGKLWKTVDGGRTWTLANDGIHPRAEIGRIIVDEADSRRIYLGTSRGFYRSDDGGQSWQRRVDGLDTGVVRDLAAHHDRERGRTTLYLVDQVAWAPDGHGSIRSSGGVFASDDGGDSWRGLNAGLRLDLAALPSAQRDLTVRARYFIALGKWFEISPARAARDYPRLPADVLPSFDRIAVDPTDARTLYAMGNAQHGGSFLPAQVFASRDGGARWHVAARAGTGWRDDAAYWTARGTPAAANMRLGYKAASVADQPYNPWGFSSLAVSPTGEAWLWHYQQLFRSTDRGESWANRDEIESPPGRGYWVSRGDANPPGRGAVGDPATGAAYLLTGENGLWRTDPAADPRLGPPPAAPLAWPESARSISTMAIHPDDPNTIAVIPDRQNHPGELRISTDRGASWSTRSTPVAVRCRVVSAALSFHPRDPDQMFFCVPRPSMRRRTDPDAATGVYFSADAGETWEIRNSGLPADADVVHVAPDPRAAGAVFAAVAGAGGGLFHTRDSGKSWARLPPPAGVAGVNHAHVRQLDAARVRVLISCGNPAGPPDGGGLWSTDTDGAEWRRLLDLPNVVHADCAADLDRVLAVLGPHDALGGVNPGICVTGDGGAHWRKINRGVASPDAVVNANFDPAHPGVLWGALWGAGHCVAVLDSRHETP